MRDLPALPGREIEHEDLHGIHASGPRPAVREGYPATVRAEGHRRGNDPESPEVPQAADEVLPDGEAPVAARRSEAAQSAPVGADVEDALLLRGEPRRCQDRE